MTAPPPTHLRDANTVGGNQLNFIHEQNQRTKTPLRGALSFCYFFFGHAKKK